MNAKSLTVTEAVRNFSDYISRVAYRHESFVLYKGKKPMAELRPIPVESKSTLKDLPDIFRKIPRLTEEEAKAFADDIEAARRALPRGGLRDPWAS